MRLISALGLAALTGLGTALPVADHTGEGPHPDYSFYNYLCDDPEFPVMEFCDADGNLLSCNNGVATLYVCDGGCQPNCGPPNSGPCSTPFCTNKRLHWSPRTGNEPGSVIRD